MDWTINHSGFLFLLFAFWAMYCLDWEYVRDIIRRD